MKATMTSKGQITIPLGIRQRLGLKAGQVLDFDETVSYLKATRAIEAGAWRKFGQKAVNPWPKLNSTQIVERLRGKVALPPGKRKSK